MALVGFDYVLTWLDFNEVPHISLHDNEFAQIHPEINFRNIHLTWKGRAVSIGKVDVTIGLVRNDCKIVQSHKTEALLRHEQVHYDIITLTARVLHQTIQGLSAKSVHELRIKAIQLQAELQQRATTIDARYDKQTDHGRNIAAQQTWQKSMVIAKQSVNGIIDDLPA